MLSRFSGIFGMVGGQMLDMKGEGQSLTLEQVQLIHANKTGALLVFPFLAAGRIAKQSEKVILELGTAGQLLGLAFQVRDDILDVTADFEAIGKTPNKDIAADKSTYPALLGVEKSYEILDDSLNQAVAIFQNLEEETVFKAGCILPIIERLRLHA